MPETLWPSEPDPRDPPLLAEFTISHGCDFEAPVREFIKGHPNAIGYIMERCESHDYAYCWLINDGWFHWSTRLLLEPYRFLQQQLNGLEYWAARGHIRDVKHPQCPYCHCPAAKVYKRKMPTGRGAHPECQHCQCPPLSVPYWENLAGEIIYNGPPWPPSASAPYEMVTTVIPEEATAPAQRG